MSVTKTHSTLRADRRSLPPLYALRAFEAAARLGSFSRAAEVLHLTPGAVSRHIRTLEAWFDCTLFIRKGPRVEATTAAHRFAQQLQEGFQALESACKTFDRPPRALRLKAPSTLTIRWLLDALHLFHEDKSRPEVEIASVWMDTDTVDFSHEPYDCAILLGNGSFGVGTKSAPLFEEWLIPVCAPEWVDNARSQLSSCALIHPSPDRRDWARWLNKTGRQMEILKGKVFDTLEQGNLAAISGHGVSVADLLLSREAIASQRLALPFSEAVATGESYYMVWPQATSCGPAIDTLYAFLQAQAPGDFPPGVRLIR